MRCLVVRLALSLLLSLCLLPALAQTGRSDSLSWADFVDMFLTEMAEEENVAHLEAIERELEELHAQPLDINQATRSDLLALPFISQAQADSILSYREKKHRFYTLGELMFVHGLPHDVRLFMPLFFYCGEPQAPQTSFLGKLYRGHFDAEGHLSVPTYQREGERTPTVSELAKAPGKYYAGNGLAGTLRLRYKWGSAVAYGLTFNKDAGEPFAANGCRPFDYNSFYFHYRDRRSELLIGDFEVRAGQGLLFGNSSFSTRLGDVATPRRRRAQLKAHTSLEENRFLRGVAAARSWGAFSLLAYASVRRLDATVSADTARTLLTTGYHRTLTELGRKDALACYGGGLHAAYEQRNLLLGLSAYGARFGKPVKPLPRYWNAHYFHGRSMAGLSADYYWHAGRVVVQGEAALDGGLHYAMLHTLHARLPSGCLLSASLRSFSPSFSSLAGSVVQQASRPANEHGLRLGAVASPLRFVELTAYADLFLMPEPVYRNRFSTHGAEAYVGARYAPRSRWSWSASVRYKARETGLAGSQTLKQYVHTTRLTLRASAAYASLTLHPQLSFAAFSSQEGETSLGCMASLRARWQRSERLQASAFGALFFSDDYRSALYAYEPQLPRSGGIPSFFNHGFRLAATLQLCLRHALHCGLRAATLHYFNRSTIGSGAQTVHSSWKTDIELYLRLSGPLFFAHSHASSTR